MTHTGNRNSQGVTELIKTSQGRTVLDIAIQDMRVDILKYLVNQKNLSVSTAGKDVKALLALEAVIKAMPQSIKTKTNKSPSKKTMKKTNYLTSPEMSSSHPSFQKNMSVPSYKISSPTNSTESEIFDDIDDAYDSDLDDSRKPAKGVERNDDESVSTTVQDPVSHR
jgi:hypothetical protein